MKKRADRGHFEPLVVGDKFIWKIWKYCHGLVTLMQSKMRHCRITKYQFNCITFNLGPTHFNLSRWYIFLKIKLKVINLKKIIQDIGETERANETNLLMRIPKSYGISALHQMLSLCERNAAGKPLTISICRHWSRSASGQTANLAATVAITAIATRKKMTFVQYANFLFSSNRRRKKFDKKSEKRQNST